MSELVDINNSRANPTSNPRDVEDIWKDHFTYYYREFDEFIFPMTIHPGKFTPILTFKQLADLLRC